MVGDFFLVLPERGNLEDRTLIVIVADLSGKGLQAAMIASSIVGGLRMHVSRKPAELLGQLNQMLVETCRVSTLVAFVLIGPDGRPVIANAGYRATYCNGVELPIEPGVPLGVVANLVYKEVSLSLDPKGQLTFMSDGVLEAVDSSTGQLFGYDRAREVSTRSASEIANSHCVRGERVTGR